MTELVLEPAGDDPGRGATDSTVPSHPAGDVSKLTCPACGSALWEEDEGATARYQCRTGHAYAQESLLDAQNETIETALWSAYRALLERADLARRMARRLHRLGVERSADRYHRMADVAQRQAMVMRNALVATIPTISAVDDVDNR